MKMRFGVSCLLAVLTSQLQGTGAQQYVLTPPYFNIAENRPITANATCGVGSNVQKEMYCKLVAGIDRLELARNKDIIDGQVCDYCYAPGTSDDPAKMHGPENAVDGNPSTHWQSPPISRGRKYNRVDLEINLLQDFIVAYVVVTMADSPRPGVWALEKSVDGGETWTPWQYFAGNDVECQKFFGMHADAPIRRDDDVICSTEFSKVLPIEGGEIYVRLTNGRPSENDIQGSDSMMSWLRATNIRLRLFQTKTMLGHLMSIAQGDQTVTRRYYYAIREISVGGRCLCNGHAYVCPPSPDDPNILQCECQRNTAGMNCDRCAPGFTQKQWRRYSSVDPFECEPCNCNGHTDKCHYNQTVADLEMSMDIHGKYIGGGVCEECKHFTTGINCDQCIPGYFRPEGVPANASEPCIPCACDGDHRYTGSCASENGQCECREPFRGAEDCTVCAQGYHSYPECLPCDCFPNGTRSDESGFPHCVTDDGAQCPCKDNYGGAFCDQCAPGYYNFPECIPCACLMDHSVDYGCDAETGQCRCERTYSGRTCDQCSHGHYRYPDCYDCNCDVQGTVEEICSKEDGTCMCKEGYTGPRCDRCEPGYYGYPNCIPCECSKEGSNSPVCDQTSGQCPCFNNYGGRQCSYCSPGYYAYPDCKICSCDSFGSVGQSCDDNGNCKCITNFIGSKCDKCAPERFNFPSCEECNCDPRGVADDFFQRGGCNNVPKGELCTCKEMVTGRTCNVCKPLYWNLQKWRVEGCEACDCNRNGTVGSLGECDLNDGQCVCKPAVDGSRKCDECMDGFYGLAPNSLLGCQECGCDLGGSYYEVGGKPTCSKDTGECECKYGIIGRQCNEVQPEHYVPTLFQHKFEIEDGYRADGSLVRFAYDPTKFPDYSWRGYAAFSPLQKQVLQDIKVTQGSIYRVILRYQNPNPEPITGYVQISSSDAENPVKISDKFVLEPTNGQPAFVTVSGEAGVFPSPFDLYEDDWTVSVNVDNRGPDNQEVLVDYFVLLPMEYSEPTTLVYDIHTPCLRRTDTPDYCREYKYPQLLKFPTGMAADAVQPGGYKVFDYAGPPEDLSNLGISDAAQIMGSSQSELKFNIPTDGGPHAIVLVYFTPEPDSPGALLQVGDSQGGGRGTAFTFDCPYNTPCRQVVTDPEGRIVEFDLTKPSAPISVRASSPDDNVAIERVVLVPLDQWSVDYITPFAGCVRDARGECRLPKPFPPVSDGSSILLPALTDNRIREQGPPPQGVTDPEMPLMKIDRDLPEAVASGKITRPGEEYVIVAHYHQPDHPTINVPVTITIGGSRRPAGDMPPEDIFAVYESVLPLPNCQSSIGCRQTVPQDESASKSEPGKFPMATDVVDIQFTNMSPDSAWIEYVLAVPASEFDPAIMRADDSIDKRGEFIDKCGRDNFYISEDIEEGFCKESATSLAAGFNDGALPCECNREGSTNLFKCAPFGGQCECKDNVIGRQCTRCAPGFYGFPECRQCSCPPTATCNEETGECICAPFVTGSQENPCSECEVNTFGYDPITGCQECNCMVEGTIGGNMTCTQESGQCYCKENVEGRTCDQCSFGSYQYPDCMLCDCSLEGTTETICDQTNAACFCKANVVGERCATCLDGHFNLQGRNPDGCTKCFCFGRGTNCTSMPNMEPLQISDMDGWRGVVYQFNRNVAKTNLNMDPLVNYGGSLDMAFTSLPSSVNLTNQVFYFESPRSYAGSQIFSYGNGIVYNISHYGNLAPDHKKYPDVILVGGGMTLLHFSGMKLDYGDLTSMYARLEPHYWVLPTGGQVTRSKLMVVLNNLQNIYVRGSYSNEKQSQVRLQTIYLQSAKENEGNVENPVLTVEQCECPEGYTGSSCEMCAPGYWSEREDQWGPVCIKCNCYGHANTCHPRTGKCKTYVPTEPFNTESLPIAISDNFCHYFPDKCMLDPSVNHCSDHTRGDNCELCEVGYYGDATLGTPDACQSCPCPLQDNNFAVSCDGLFTSTVPEEQVCICQPNYVGDRCQHCGPGYFGNPDQADGFCQPCACNQNINVTDPNACNRKTGVCELCLYNTYGSSCERCEPWYYGDAVNAKDCRECDCDRDGTAECDHVTGQCRCFPGVEGERCDRCQADHYGFTYGGCTFCNCSEASLQSQCDLETGQCLCKPGVTGGKCERCLNGYWNLGPYGCESCGCNVEFAIGGGCNQLTGQCECLPGVVGQNCDSCPPNWILIMNETRTYTPEWKRPFNYEEGCFPCSSCVEDLMASANTITSRLVPIMQDFNKAQKNYFAYRRIDFFNEEIDNLRPEIDLLNADESNKRIQPLNEQVRNLQWTSRSLNIDFQMDLMKEREEQARALVTDGMNTVTEMQDVNHKVMDIIKDVTDISENLGQGVTAQILETSVQSGRDLLQAMQDREFSEYRRKAEDEKELSRELKERVKEWSTPFDEFRNSLKATNDDLVNFSSKLSHLRNQTETADKMSSEAKQKNFRNSAGQVQMKIERIDQLNEASKANLMLGNDMIRDAEGLLDSARTSYGDMNSKSSDMEEYTDTFDDRLRRFEAEKDNMFTLEREADIKAEDLTMAARELKNMAESSKRPAETALQAAKAYEDIIKMTNDASSAADEALLDADKAFSMSDGVSTKTRNALDKIQQMYEQATDAEGRVYNDLDPELQVSERDIELVGEKVREIKQNLATISKQVEKIEGLGDTIDDTAKEANAAKDNARDALTSINARASEISQNKQEAYELRNAHSAMNLYITNIKKALNEYEQRPEGRRKRDAYQSTDINDRLERLMQRKEAIMRTGDRVTSLVGSLREKLNQAREALAQIEHPGVTFTRGSNLELQNPDNFEDLATVTDVSFYVNLTNSGGGEERAFLLYMGNLEGTFKKVPAMRTDDYMALQVVKGGYVQLTMDLGAGPLELLTPRPIIFNEWNRLTVNRRGNDVSLKLEWGEGPGDLSDLVEGQLNDVSENGEPIGAVFNLHPELSRIYVGGFPTESTPVQEGVRATDMEGQIEGLTIRDKKIGLWNLRNSKMISGASARNKFISQKKDEARFSGDSYVSIDPVNYYLDGETSEIQLTIKPDSVETGMLLLAGTPGAEFVQLFFNNGALRLSLFMGGSSEFLDIGAPPDLIQAGNFYRIKVTRNGQNVRLSVDDQVVDESTVVNGPRAMPSPTNLFIGGQPNQDNVVANGFVGCISNMKIEPDFVNLNRESRLLNSVNVRPSCSLPVKTTVSFSGDNPDGYVHMPPIATDGALRFTFMFRTAASNGMLAFLQDETEQFYVSLSLVDGAINLYAFPDNEIVTKEDQDKLTTFNDNDWHVVSLYIGEDAGENVIRLSVDDNYAWAPKNVANIPLTMAGIGYNGYYGGVPTSMRPLRAGLAATETALVGCIKDVILQNVLVDFANATSMENALLGECVADGHSSTVTSKAEEPSVDGDTQEKTPDKEIVTTDSDPGDVDGSDDGGMFDWGNLYNQSGDPYNARQIGQCRLPLSPPMDPDLNAQSGMRFGTKSNSFMEYLKRKLPDQMVDKFKFRLDFKTTFSDGLIFYMRNNDRADFVAVYLQRGELVFSFDCGSGPSRLATSSDRPINDGNWHSVEFSRVYSEGKLVLDDREVKVPDIDRFSMGSTRKLEVNPYLYLGGLDENMKQEDRTLNELRFNNFKGGVPGFVGCLRNVRVEVMRQGRPRMRSLGMGQKNVGVLPCSEKVERGFFFGPNGGRIRAFRRYRIGLDFDITMWIKPRNITGVLLAIRGRRDYVILQLVDGAIQFTVDNGRGPITALFKPDDKYQFCNGEWHEIHAVKAKNVVTLSVNKIFAQPGIGVPGVSSTDTNHPLFLGGHPRPSRLKLDNYAEYVGCMRDIFIEGREVEIEDDMLVGDIHSHVCSTI